MCTFCTENTPALTENKAPFFLPYPSKLPVKLHTKDSLQKFSSYLDGDTYKFPLGNYSVDIPEYLLTTININKYFGGYVAVENGRKFADGFALVKDFQTFIKDGTIAYNETYDNIVKQAHLFLIASGILDVSEEALKDSVVMTDEAKSQWLGLMLEAKELDSTPMNDSRKQQMLDELVMSRKSDVMSSMEYAFCVMIADLETLCKAAILSRYDYVMFKLPFTQEEGERMKTIRDNTIAYITDKKQLLETLSRSIIFDLSNPEPIRCLVRNFYHDSEIMKQLEILSDFLLMRENYRSFVNEAEEEENSRRQKELEEKRGQLSKVLSMTEQSSSDIRQKIELLKSESKKIDYDASSELSGLEKRLKRLESQEEQARQERLKQQREEKLNTALAMSENSANEIRLKLQAVKREAVKIGYDSFSYTKDISERLKEAERNENNQRSSKMAQDIIWEAIIYPLNAAAAKGGIAKYFHGLVFGSSDNDSFINKNLDNIYSRYASEMDYPFEEIPILYYDDTLSKNGNDSVLITPFKIYASVFGKVSSMKLEEAEDFKCEKKLLSNTVIVNNKLKISATLVSGKELSAFSGILQLAAHLAVVVRNIFKKDSEGHLMREDDEVLKYILDELQKGPVDEALLKLFANHLYSIGADYLLKDAPERFKNILSEDKKNTPLGTDIIIKAVHSVKIDNLYFEAGNPTIEPSSRKYANAKRNLKIPDDEDIFMIFDATILGGVRKGFALCTNGLYYCTDSAGFMDWDKFSKVKIEKSSSGIKIANQEFLCSIENQMLKILTNLQERIREKLH